jgi:uncharacterized protein
VKVDDLRRYAVARSLFAPTTLKRALDRFGFVQADPIRAPARAQDLILRHRVNGYRAGDLERRYESLDVHEDFFINYGFITSALQQLMHPREREARWGGRTRSGRRMRAVMEFVQTRGTVHPREVDEYFAHGKVTNYWGGSSNATTHLLDAMHYRGLLRVVRRERGIRIYAAHEHATVPRTAATRRAHLDTLTDTAIDIYAPVPGATLSWLVRRLRYAAPQWQSEIDGALRRARERLGHARAADIDWYFPAGDDPFDAPAASDTVRLLAPFDPIVWDRRRFEILWGWAYRFEAYTPHAKRKLGYYALPLLWKDRVIGWGNLSVKDGALRADFGYSGSQPTSRAFRRALDEELDRMRAFLGIES